MSIKDLLDLANIISIETDDGDVVVPEEKDDAEDKEAPDTEGNDENDEIEEETDEGDAVIPEEKDETEEPEEVEEDEEIV